MWASSAPVAVKWYRWFCMAMVALNVGLALWLTALGSSGQDAFGVSAQTLQAAAHGLAVIGWALAAINALFLLLPRRDWAYALHLSNLGISATSLIWLPVAGPLLRAFMGDQIRGYFCQKEAPMQETSVPFEP